ncbi:inclusion body family protein (plasmid) [Rhizobium ruizarguesonis]|uniref:DNA-directed RNA polymerase subunit beta n=2 Tax=Rhizobium TaxID=379 RepID=A0A179BXL8_RHILE|nr:inclusion body family protein [Rhizobium leguminosarum]OAP96417.1 DNA-directed RNA polymerase subunit beta [Rhizobium leguminosarum]
MAIDTLPASAQQIGLLTVIDTVNVRAHHKPNNHPDHPQPINHQSQFMICTGSRGEVTGQCSSALSFHANVGDSVSFAGTSVHNNSDDAIILCGITHASGDQLFNRFQVNSATRNKAAVPDANSRNGLPARHRQLTFSTYDAGVRCSGTAKLYVRFALYKLADDGQTQKLYGYFQWDPQITVN